MKIFAKKFYGFDPENVPVITFNLAGSRNKLLKEANPGDRILFVATTTEETSQYARGKILGMAEIGDGAVNSEDLIQDKEILSPDFFDEKGKFRWSKGIPMRRAWKFTPPIDRLKVLEKSIDKQSTRQNAILLSEDEKYKILSLSYQEVSLPDTTEILNKLAGPYALKKEKKPSNRIFGNIPGVDIGTTFIDRKSLSQAGVHKPLVAGISGSATEGSDSIVVSGGYEDDEDLGEVIVYTGHGGNDPNTGKQISDQTFTRNNLALALNERLGLPVRVIRGSSGNPKTSPSKGYRYDGLFYVQNHWEEIGRSGFKIFRYKLQKERVDSADITTLPPEGTQNPHREETTTLRLVRDTKVSNWVKKQHNFKCQVCGIAVDTQMGPYAEGAHIIPLGIPHNGEDTADNMLCLCPNHHVSFDKGGFSIAEDLSLIGTEGRLRVLKGHDVSEEALEHHRKRFGYKGTSK